MEDEVQKKEKKATQKITVFGHDVGDEQRFCHGRGGSITWGFLFIVVGGILLCNTLGIFPWNIWELISKIWPVLIILVGIDVIFSRFWLTEILGSIVTFFILATTIGIVIMKVSPDTLAFLPSQAINFLSNISSYIKLQ